MPSVTSPSWVEPVCPTRFPAQHEQRQASTEPRQRLAIEQTALYDKVIAYLHQQLDKAILSGEAFSAANIAQALHAPDHAIEAVLARLHEQGRIVRDVDTLHRPTVVQGPFGPIALDGGSSTTSSHWRLPASWLALS